MKEAKLKVSKSMLDVPKMDDEEEKEYEEHEIDCAVNDLLRAEEIRQDPALMKKVLERAEKKKQAITSIMGLRKKAAEVSKRDADKE